VHPKTNPLISVFFTSLVVGNVGDSRAILCCDDSGQPVQLTIDHTASLPDERRRIEAMGGEVVFKGCWRVGGELALTRSIGDLLYEQYLSREPHVVVRGWPFNPRPARIVYPFLPHQGSHSSHFHPSAYSVYQVRRLRPSDQFMVLASDGLWDVMDNEDVVTLVKTLAAQQHEAQAEDSEGEGEPHADPDYHVIARMLTLEVRRGRGEAKGQEGADWGAFDWALRGGRDLES
jgi:protein phosphatase 1L